MKRSREADDDDERPGKRRQMDLLSSMPCEMRHEIRLRLSVCDRARFAQVSHQFYEEDGARVSGVVRDTLNEWRHTARDLYCGSFAFLEALAKWGVMDWPEFGRVAELNGTRFVMEKYRGYVLMWNRFDENLVYVGNVLYLVAELSITEATLATLEEYRQRQRKLLGDHHS